MESVVAFWTRMRDSDEPLAVKLATIAGRQHRVVSHRQLIWIGVGSTTIRRWVIAGHLHQLHRGVYAIGHPLIEQEGEWMAAVLACRKGAVLSHASAAQLWRLIDRLERFALHVSMPSRAGGSPDGIVVHRPRLLEPRDTTRRLWIPTTSATRTVWDLASALTPLQTRWAYEQAEKRDALDRSRLTLLLESAPSRRGAATIRQLLSERPLPLSETRSWLEELLLITCRDHALPLPAVNVPLLGYEVDFLWQDERFVVEADGSDHRKPRQRDKDNARDIALGRAGYLVRRYSWRAMNDETAVAREVREILEERRRSPR